MCIKGGPRECSSNYSNTQLFLLKLNPFFSERKKKKMKLFLLSVFTFVLFVQVCNKIILLLHIFNNFLAKSRHFDKNCNIINLTCVSLFFISFPHTDLVPFQSSRSMLKKVQHFLNCLIYLILNWARHPFEKRIWILFREYRMMSIK